MIFTRVDQGMSLALFDGSYCEMFIVELGRLSESRQQYVMLCQSLIQVWLSTLAGSVHIRAMSGIWTKSGICAVSTVHVP